MQKFDRTRSVKSLAVLWMPLLCFSLSSARLTAQSGMLMNNGASITTSSGQVSIFASSASTRAAMINGSISTSNVLVLAAWPCTALGGLLYSGGVSLMGGYGTETCTPAGTLGQILQSGGTGGPAWTPFKLPTSVGATNTPLASNGTDYVAGTVTGNTSEFATATGTFTSSTGQATTIDANGNLQVSGIVPRVANTSLKDFLMLPYATSIVSSSGGAAVIETATNVARFVQFTLQAPFTAGRFDYYVSVAHSGNNMDFCVYDSGGSLLANMGAQNISSAGQKQTAFVQGSVTFQMGVYYLSWTTNETTPSIQILAQNNSANFQGMYNNGSAIRFGHGTATTGGACNSTLGTLTADTSAVIPFIGIEP